MSVSAVIESSAGRLAGSNTGADGHPADAPFLPPIPGRRRMFAGGRLRQEVPIPLGAMLASRSGVSDVRVKTGRSGEMAFVTVRHELLADGRTVGVEEQDIVYRSEPAGSPARTLPRPEAGGADPEGEWRVELATDAVVLFRFSALTYNGHRIHYDRPYATQVEGYPDLVVQAPLTAVLLADLARRRMGRMARQISFRARAPLFVNRRVWLTGHRVDDEAAELAAVRGDHAVAMTLQAR
jgi:3-methylfumaryl-CoA hydratase